MFEKMDPDLKHSIKTNMISNARIDMRMDLNGEVYIIDVNCNCNLRPGSKSFLRQFGNESFTKTIDKIVYHAMHKPPFC